LQETAAALDKTEAAIKALQHRGLAALRGLLMEEPVQS
jgi:DNA-directed RNA polymerase specialized sigma24 family protein